MALHTRISDYFRASQKVTESFHCGVGKSVFDRPVLSMEGGNGDTKPAGVFGPTTLGDQSPSAVMTEDYFVRCVPVLWGARFIYIYS